MYCRAVSVEILEVLSRFVFFVAVITNILLGFELKKKQSVFFSQIILMVLTITNLKKTIQLF